MIDVMTMPNKETLQFTREVSRWIQKEIKQNGILKFIFKEDTPLEVLELFEQIKGKLPFKVS